MTTRNKLNDTTVTVPLKPKPATRYVPHNAPPLTDLVKTPKKVGGRTRSVMLLEEILSRPHNMLALDEAFQAEFEKDPTKFFRMYVLPFMPKKVKIVDQGLPVEIRLVNVNVMGGGS